MLSPSMLWSINTNTYIKANLIRSKNAKMQKSKNVYICMFVPQPGKNSKRAWFGFETMKANEKLMYHKKQQ